MDSLLVGEISKEGEKIRNIAFENYRQNSFIDDTLN